MRNHVVDEVLVYLTLLGLLAFTPLVTGGVYYWGRNVFGPATLLAAIAGFVVTVAVPLVVLMLRNLERETVAEA